MEDVIAAVVFIAAVAALILFALSIMAPFMQYKIVEVPASPPAGVPVRHIYVYNYTTPNGSRLYVVDYEGLSPAIFQRVAGIPGVLVAVFTVWPGGYNCTLYGRAPVRIGPDPYTGLWCPPPFENKSVAGCTPIGITSRGRWLLVQYRCP